MKRKTISVDRIKEMANLILLNSDDSLQQAREAVQIMVEKVLHETGNYNGFQYLTKEQMLESREGTTVGINRTVDIHGNTVHEFLNTDHTRVYYI